MRIFQNLVQYLEEAVSRNRGGQNERIFMQKYIGTYKFKESSYGGTSGETYLKSGAHL